MTIRGLRRCGTFRGRVALLESLPEGHRPVERPAGTGLPVVPADVLRRRAVVSAEALYSGIEFACCVCTIADGTFMALSRDFPETLGHANSAKEALRELRLNAESTLEGAMDDSGVYRVPLEPRAVSLRDIASMLDDECASTVTHISMTSIVLFP